MKFEAPHKTSAFLRESLPAWLAEGCLVGLTSARFFVAWGKPQRQEAPSADRPSLYAPDFYLEEKNPWWVFPHFTVVSKDELVEALKALPKPDKKVSWKWEEPKLKDFALQFHLIQKEFEKGDAQKIVPAVFETAKVPGWQYELPKLIRKTLENAAKRVPYGLWNEEQGILGASPEILFDYRNEENTLESMALAGTRAVAKEKLASIAQDPKEMFEHDLVVKDLRGRLRTLGDLRISPTYVWDIGKICHLRTDMEVELSFKPKNPTFFYETIRMLHPTPALGVAPRTFPFTWLKNCDGKVKRRRFGAPFGLLNVDSSARVLVAIRNVQWYQNQFFLGAGCGVVPQSDVDNEWKELRIKRRTIKDLLGLE